MDRYLKLDHDFVGRAALEAEMARRPGTADGLPRGRPRPRRARRRHRRRTDLARRRGGRLGDVRRVRALQRRVAGARLHPCRAGDARDAAATRQAVWRSRSSGTDVLPVCSANRSSIRAVNECVRDGCVNDGEARRRPSPHRTARRRRRLPRRARHRGLVVAADGEVARASASTPSSTTSAPRTTSWSPRCSAPSMCRTRCRCAGRHAIQGSRRPSCSDAGGDGSTPRRRTWRWCDSGSRPPPSTRPRPDCRDRCEPIRSGSGDRTSSNAWSPRVFRRTSPPSRRRS